MPGYMNGGIKRKYIISKVNGKPVDKNAVYFVLRVDKDPHAIPALLAYAKSVEKDNPEFACDVEALAESKSWDDFNL